MPIAKPELLNARILIVDDQPATVRLLAEMLAGAGYTRISSTTNSREVCSLHREHDYDLILLDLQMPGMDGLEVIEALKQIEPVGYVPVLVLTGQPSHRLRALRAGARDFVSKPFDVLEILTRIHNMLVVRLLYKKVEKDNKQLELVVLQRTAELRESEGRFRSLVELASDWYWEQDENGLFTKVSGPALEMLGLSDEVTEEGDDRSRWNERERALLGEKLAMRRPFLDFVYSRVNSDGHKQFFQTSGEPKFDGSGRFTGYRGIGMDVTARMRSGCDLTCSADLRRFRTAMDDIAHAIFLLERSTMRFVDVNAAACRMFGYSRDELLACGPGTLTGQPDNHHEDEYDRLIAGSGDFGFSQIQLLRKDGSLLSVEVHRQASRTESGWMLVEVVRDMTEVN